MRDFISAIECRQPGMQNTNDIFYSETRPCFYIPQYKGMFCWPSEQRLQLLQDITDGLQHLCAAENPKTSDAITFLGAQIWHHTTDSDSVFPAAGDTAGPPDANHLYGIIDGQQRMTMLMLAATVLHDAIHQHSKTDRSEWLPHLAYKCKHALANVFEIRSLHDVQYPRIARAEADVWAKTPADMKYVSPLTHYLHRYSTHLLTAQPGDSIIATTLANMNGADYQPLREAIGEMQKHIAEFCRGKDAMVNALQDSDALSEALWLHNCFRYDHEKQPPTPQQNELLAAIMLARYLQYRVYFLIICTSVENFAFDIFQSLNTSGQPLTPPNHQK